MSYKKILAIFLVTLIPSIIVLGLIIIIYILRLGDVKFSFGIEHYIGLAFMSLVCFIYALIKVPDPD